MRAAAADTKLSFSDANSGLEALEAVPVAVNRRDGESVCVIPVVANRQGIMQMTDQPGGHFA